MPARMPSGRSARGVSSLGCRLGWAQDATEGNDAQDVQVRVAEVEAGLGNAEEDEAS
jgi:hypothetical protein